MTQSNEWVSFVDDENTTWLFDLTFLTSNWRCTFGSTCRGTEPGDNGARGCCAHGAHLVDDAERQAIIAFAQRLTSEQWQNRDLVATSDDLFAEVDGDQTTARVDDACIFLNDAGFAGGHGCALHIGAVAANERPLDWKPTVCWQLPFRLEQYEDGSGTYTIAVRAWRRSDWGDGGDAFEWFCTDELTPGDASNATWTNHGDELEELVGEWPLAQLRAYLTQRSETAVSIGEGPVETDRAGGEGSAS